MSPLLARGAAPARTRGRAEPSVDAAFAAELARLLHLDPRTATRFRRVGRRRLPRRAGPAVAAAHTRGSYQYLGPPAYAAVRAWLRAAWITDGPLLRSVHVTGRVGAGLHAGSVSAVLTKLAWRAAPALRRQGIDREQVSGHSCRVGMAQDLAAAGFDVVAVVQAGRWTSPGMVARYVERLHVARGAVAQYHRALARRR